MTSDAKRILKVLTYIESHFQEGSSAIYAPLGKISKKLPVFYNPDMKLGRDICILLLKSVNLELEIADILAGAGVRSIRLLLELPESQIKSISINDKNPEAIKLIKRNLKLNKILNDKINLHNLDANKFLTDFHGFNYIDIDPFGSPNPFLDSAINRLSRGGILAVTATDTSALAGSHPESCQRKYWAKPLKNELMHEIGMRILMRKIQLIGAQHEKALTPIFCHSTRHYYRAYFSCTKSCTNVDKMLQQHGYLLYCPKCLTRKTSTYNKEFCCKETMDFAGPLWLGKLWDPKLVNNMHVNLPKENKKLAKLITIIKNESQIPTVGFYDTHTLSKKLKKSVPKLKVILEKIKQQKTNAAPTHFAPASIRSNISLDTLEKLAQ